jgi:hypothetical protein
MNFDSDNYDLEREELAREDRWRRQVAARCAIPYNHPDAVDLPDDWDEE